MKRHTNAKTLIKQITFVVQPSHNIARGYRNPLACFALLMRLLLNHTIYYTFRLLISIQKNLHQTPFTTEDARTTTASSPGSAIDIARGYRWTLSCFAPLLRERLTAFSQISQLTSTHCYLAKLQIPNKIYAFIS